MSHISEGDICLVKKSDEDEVIVVDIHPDRRQDEEHVTWDYDMNKVYAYDYEENQEYPPDVGVADVVYIKTLERKGLRIESSVEHILSVVDKASVYTFPIPRLKHKRSR